MQYFPVLMYISITLCGCLFVCYHGVYSATMHVRTEYTRRSIIFFVMLAIAVTTILSIVLFFLGYHYAKL